jgi:hypothetical protein
LECAPGLEREPNDSLETAEQIAAGVSVSGYVGWAGDADTYCVDGAQGAVRAEVSEIAGVDLVLRWVDRVQAISRRVNHGGIGEGEISPPVADARPGRTCFEVSARRQTAGSRPSRSDARYRLTVVPAPAPPRSR